MISLLGKRPFKGKSDDMDKWLDENQKRFGERSAPPPLEEAPGPATTDEPAPVAVATRVEDLNKL